VPFYLPLVDEAFFLLVNEFNGIFNRNDMVQARHVYQVYHCSQRSTLAAARGTGNHDEAFGQIAEVPDAFGQAQLVRGEHLCRNHTEDCAHAHPVPENVGPQPDKAWHVVGKVRIVLFHEFLLVPLGDYLRYEMLHVGILEDRQVQLPHLATFTYHWAASRRYMQVAAVRFYEHSEECIDLGHGRSPCLYSPLTMCMMLTAFSRANTGK
jgi:hypothetical protein